MKRIEGGTNVATQTADYRPLTITGTAASPTVFYFAYPQGDSEDSNSYPTPEGVWTFIADDFGGSTSGACMSVSMTSKNGAATISAPTFTEGTAGTGVIGSGSGSTVSPLFTLVSGGSGYTDTPKVTISGGGGSGATAWAAVGNGSVAAVYLLATGIGYTSTPTVTISGGGGTGASATCTTGPVISGRTWQWTTARNGVGGGMSLVLNVWTTAGGTYPYTLTNECLLQPSAALASAPAIPSRSLSLAMDPGMTSWLTTPTPKYPSILRFMDSTFGFPLGNMIEPEDLKSQNSWSYYAPPLLSGSALTAQPTATRTFNVVGVRTYALSATGYPSGIISDIVITNPGSGYSVAPTITIGDSGLGHDGDGDVHNQRRSGQFDHDHERRLRLHGRGALRHVLGTRLRDDGDRDGGRVECQLVKPERLHESAMGR